MLNSLVLTVSILSGLVIPGSFASGPSPVLSPYVLHEKRVHTPSGWLRARRYDPSAVLPLRFGLKQSNIDAIEEFLLDVSRPGSANYGKHWSPSKIAATFAPSDESISTVHGWLVGSGISVERLRITPTKGWIEVNATVAEAEELLSTEYHVYSHENGQEHIACDEYHLPSHVSSHVDLVTPSVHFNSILGKRSSESAAKDVGQLSFRNGLKSTGAVEILASADDTSNCDKQTTVACLRALYNFYYTPVSSTNSYGIVEYTPQAFLQSDLDIFFAEYASDLVGKPPIQVSIDGGFQQTLNESFAYEVEPDLDLQYAMALVTSGLNISLYQVGDLQEDASFNNFLDALDGSYCTFDGGDDSSQDAVYPDPASGGYKGVEDCGTVTPAYVISTSYGANEAYLTPFYAARQCNEYAKLGLMGVTVLYSSGDYGVAGNGGLCLNSDGSQSTSGTIFNPSFPGTCPYVTTIGATQVSPGNTVSDLESACEQTIYSGGGFSNYFSIPSYQQSAVSQFFDTWSTSNFTSSVYNSSGTSRGYPDISANGANYVVAVVGQFELVYGTSASTPVVGSMISMINDARIAAGKSPVGFINPTIYDSSFQCAFNDITTGGNQGCGTEGFTAVTGWDPVTGLGTPDFSKLLELWLALD